MISICSSSGAFANAARSCSDVLVIPHHVEVRQPVGIIEAESKCLELREPIKPPFDSLVGVAPNLASELVSRYGDLGQLYRVATLELK